MEFLTAVKKDFLFFLPIANPIIPSVEYAYASRKKAAKIQNKFLEKRSDIIVPYIKGEIDSHVFHQYTIRVNSKKRDLLASFLQENKIPYGIYYPVPLHLQKAYANNQFKNETFINTNKVVKEVISLPMHTELTFDQIEYISNKIIEFLNR